MVKKYTEYKKMFLVSKLRLRIFFALILKFIKNIISMIKKWCTKGKIDLRSVHIKSKSKIKAKDMVEIKIELNLS